MRPGNPFYCRAARLLSLGIPENSREGKALKQFLLGYNFYYSPPDGFCWPRSPLSRGVTYYQDDGIKSGMMSVVSRLFCEIHGIDSNNFTPLLVSDSSAFYGVVCKRYAHTDQSIKEVSSVKEVEGIIKPKAAEPDNMKVTLVVINFDGSKESDANEYFKLIQQRQMIHEGYGLKPINIVFLLRCRNLFFVLTPPDDSAEDPAWQRSRVLEALYQLIGNHGLLLGMHEIIRVLAEKGGNVRTILSQFDINTPDVPIVNEMQHFKTVTVLIQSSQYRTLKQALQTSGTRFSRWFLPFIGQMLTGLENEVNLEEQSPAMKQLLWQSLNIMAEMMQKMSLFLQANAAHDEVIVCAYLLLEEWKLWVDLIDVPTEHPILNRIALGPKDQNQLCMTGSGQDAFYKALNAVEENFQHKILDDIDEKLSENKKPLVLVVNGRSTYYKLEESFETMGWKMRKVSAVDLGHEFRTKYKTPIVNDGAQYDVVMINVFPAHAAKNEREKNEFQQSMSYHLEQRYVNPVTVIEALVNAGKLAKGAVMLIDNTMSPYAHPECIQQLMPLLEKHGLRLILFSSLTKLGFCGMDTAHAGMVQLVDPSRRWELKNSVHTNGDLSQKFSIFLARHCFASMAGYLSEFSDPTRQLFLKFSSGMKTIPIKIPYSYLVFCFNNKMTPRLLPLLMSVGLSLSPRDAYGFPTATYCFIEDDVRLSPGIIELNLLEIMVLILIELSRQKPNDHLFQRDGNHYRFSPLVSERIRYLMTRYHGQTAIQVESKSTDDQALVLWKKNEAENQGNLEFLSKHSLYDIVGPNSSKTKSLFGTSKEFEPFQQKISVYFFWESLILLMTMCDETTFFKSVFGNHTFSREIQRQLNGNIHGKHVLITQILALFSRCEALLDYAQSLEKTKLVMWLCAMDETLSKNIFESSDDEKESDEENVSIHDGSSNTDNSPRPTSETEANVPESPSP